MSVGKWSEEFLSVTSLDFNLPSCTRQTLPRWRPLLWVQLLWNGISRSKNCFSQVYQKVYSQMMNDTFKK